MYEWSILTSTNGDNIFIEDENGKILYNWNSERILEGIAFGHQLRYVDQVVTSGFGAFEDGNEAIGFGEGWRVELLANSGKVNYGILPYRRAHTVTTPCTLVGLRHGYCLQHSTT